MSPIDLNRWMVAVSELRRIVEFRPQTVEDWHCVRSRYRAALALYSMMTPEQQSLAVARLEELRERLQRMSH